MRTFVFISYPIQMLLAGVAIGWALKGHVNGGSYMVWVGAILGTFNYVSHVVQGKP